MVGRRKKVSVPVSMLVLNNFTHDARVHKEAQTLAAAGYAITVVALWQPGLAKEETRSGYRVRRLHLRSRAWRGRLVAPLVKYLEFAIQVWRMAGHEPPQVLHAHDANTLPVAWLAARRVGARLVYDAHELETGRNFGSSRLAGIYQRIWSWPEHLLIRQADAVITVSEGIADELARLYRIPRPVVVVNCPEWSSPGRSNRLRDELGIPAGLKVALYLGRVAAGRGIEPFLEAVQRRPNVAGVVLGDGPLLHKLRQRVESGAWQRVYLPGRVSPVDLPEYTASADVGAALIQANCRSYYLALPNKLFEYLHAGIPVVGSNLPEIARVIRGYDVGEVVDSDDPASIAGGLRRLLDDPERYTRAQANTARAAAAFRWEQEGQKLVHLYQGLAGRSG